MALIVKPKPANDELETENDGREQGQPQSDKEKPRGKGRAQQHDIAASRFDRVVDRCR